MVQGTAAAAAAAAAAAKKADAVTPMATGEPAPSVDAVAV